MIRTVIVSSAQALRDSSANTRRNAKYIPTGWMTCMNTFHIFGDFRGTRVLVVGGTSGVGFATAKSFDTLGADVTIASRSVDKLCRAAQELSARARSNAVDIRDEAMVEAVLPSLGTFDHVVISAAETPMGSVASLSLSQASSAMDSKFWGAYRVARAVQIQAHGTLTFVSGYLSQRPGRASALQGAINAALEALMRGLAIEYAPVRVNCVSPGLLDTPLWDALDPANREGMFRTAKEKLPLGRTGTPSDVAQACIFLAGNQYSTGSTLFVDGGGRIAI